ncbi:MAG: BrnT family toxin [Ignavibacteriota bacterium]
MNLYERLKNASGFDWDEHNYYKNWLKHQVSPFESEEVFDNEPLLLDHDLKHSQTEERHIAYGKTNAGKCLLVCYTFRNDRVRVISARQMNKAERVRYEQRA